MAFVVRRPAGRWEIRESHATPAGPRARTLVTFRVLSADVIDRAERAARTPFDRTEIARAAKRAGAPMESSPAESLATSLVRTLARGEQIRPGLRHLLMQILDQGAGSADDIAEWIGSSLEERGAALVDLLGLADRLPKPRKSRLIFPGLRSA